MGSRSVKALLSFFKIMEMIIASLSIIKYHDTTIGFGRQYLNFGKTSLKALTPTLEFYNK